MTRSSHLIDALIAIRKEPAIGLRSKQASVHFLVFEDNGGRHRWTLVAASGEQLAQSPLFSSYREAAAAARMASVCAVGAPIEHQPADTRPADLSARRKIAIERDDLDAERWLDEGGSNNTEGVTR